MSYPNAEIIEPARQQLLNLPAIELALNEIGADQVVNRTTLQCLLLNLVAARGPELLEDMKQQVLGAIGNTEQSAEDPQGGERRKQLTMMRAESMFLEIEQAAGLSSEGRDPSGAN